MKKKIKLSERLKCIAGYIDDKDAVADIGTDHGYIAVHLAQANPNRNIIASDTSEGSLNSARRSASNFGVSSAIKFINAFGLDGVSPSEIDTVVIAGLGGETIVSILAGVTWTQCENIKLILQPQSKIDVLCKFLNDNGYVIREPKSVSDRGKTYTIFHIGRDDSYGDT